MDIKFTTLLYSKYSDNSKKFLDMLDEIPENIKTEFKLNLLCIDNEKVRKSILSSNQISIKTVPCILLIYVDGGVQKYEGADAFSWIEEILSKISASNEQLRIEQEKQKLIEEKKLFEQQKFLEQQRLMEEQRLLIEKQRLVEQENPEKNKKNRKQKNPPPRPKKPQNKTSIMEIETESEEDEEENVIYEDPNPRKESKESSDALSQKKETLMSAAMAMQKSRESQESSLKKMPMINQR